MSHDRDARALRDLVENCRRAVVFTGAGISTESGIPDFRSPGGLWSRLAPIPFDRFLASEEMRRETWRRKIELEAAMSGARPNRGHRAVARWVERGRVSEVVTQNIDGLHQAAGVPADRVIEIHGNGTYATCLSCARRYELADVFARFRTDERPPVCSCGGHVKPATISFGQPMPPREMARAERAALACDLMIVAGSSLVVYPAAGIPRLARENGARLAIVNREPTDLDDEADVVVRGEIGPVLGDAAGVDRMDAAATMDAADRADGGA